MAMYCDSGSALDGTNTLQGIVLVEGDVERACFCASKLGNIDKYLERNRDSK
jgi:hypothetical protein